mgnify:FL=1
MSEANDRVLFVIVQAGCSACAEAKPHAKRFAEEHDVEVKIVDLTTLDSSVDEEGIPLGDDAENMIRMLPPDSTPAYVLIYHDGTNPRTLAPRGALTADELTKWVFAL